MPADADHDHDHEQPIGRAVPDWTPAQLPGPVRLEGRHVALESLSGEHAQPLYDALCGPDDAALWTYRPTEAPPDMAALARDLATLASAIESSTFAVAAIDREPAGMASYLAFEPDMGRIEIGAIIFARSLQRTAAATEAVHLLMRHAFDDLGYRRLEWKCDSLNEPSRRAASRLGFAYEGRFASHVVVKGRNRDTDWFSVTDDEWPEVRAAHEQWLELANFDEGGEQRCALSTLTSALPRRGSVT